MTNPYKLQNGYLPSPFDHLYINTDLPISNRPEIREIYDQVYDLAETITGDIDTKFLAFQYRTNKYAFIVNGAIAFKVKSTKSYKDAYTNYKDWCKDDLGRSYSTVRREMIASRVCIDLICMGFGVLPSCVSQAELLEELHGEELYQVWNEVLETYSEDEITVGTILAVLKKEEPVEDNPVSFTVKLTKKLYHQILGLAVELEKSVVETVSYLYDNYTSKVPTVDPLAICLWQIDLQLMILENDLKSVI